MGQKKGYKQSEEHKLKISESLKRAFSEGKHRGGFKKGNKALRMTGKKHSEETKRKQSDAKKRNNPMFNEETRLKVSITRIKLGISKGAKNHNWRGGVTKESNKLRMSRKYRKWRESVLKRDNYTCKCCLAKHRLQAHHIKQFNKYLDVRYDINNGITLCHKCHSKETSKEMINNKNGIRI